VSQYLLVQFSIQSTGTSIQTILDVFRKITSEHWQNKHTTSCYLLSIPNQRAGEILQTLDEEKVQTATIVGITGSPRVGKSSPIDQLISYCRRH
jgi:pantothenate kinase